MNSWKRLKLGDICEIIMGQSPSGSSYNSDDKGIPFFQGKAEFGIRFPTVKKWTTEPSKISKNKDILISVRAPVGTVNINNIECCIGRGLCAIRPDNKKADNLYVFHFLKKSQKKIESLGTGSTFKAINKKQLEQLEILLPPLPLQKQIVSILEKAENLKQKRNETNKETQKVIQSLFYEMFGNPVKNEKGWDVKKWSEVLKIINGRNQKKVEDPNGKYPIYGSGGIMGYANDYLIPENSIIVGRKGSINKPIKVKTKFWNVDTAFGIVPNKDKLNYDYLFVYCTLFNFERLNTSTTLPSLTKVNLLHIDMPIPPLPLQEEFAKKVQLIESIQSKQHSSTKEISTLFDALMSKAFKGELT